MDAYLKQFDILLSRQSSLIEHQGWLMEQELVCKKNRFTSGECKQCPFADRCSAATLERNGEYKLAFHFCPLDKRIKGAGTGLIMVSKNPIDKFRTTLTDLEFRN